MAQEKSKTTKKQARKPKKDEILVWTGNKTSLCCMRKLNLSCENWTKSKFGDECESSSQKYVVGLYRSIKIRHVAQHLFLRKMFYWALDWSWLRVFELQWRWIYDGGSYHKPRRNGIFIPKWALLIVCFNLLLLLLTI